MYPNPASSILKIDADNFTLKDVEIFNVLGKKVFASTESEINIAHLVNGVYLLKIESDKGNIGTKRIIKN
ncbi:T9SS type A sorting domain-containing protein [Polaribacter undariae]|uniref:T9SS type A sorting domain-containing protein n=1 Tax=Polaribacter sejongensis TaxID=985043 RepID=A0AAJ1QZM1_9FLAO|nr:T9SS type A sorting domain-containing protein [Polaribacter undariae]MDN3620702.1 T9SS type A sorting domain-containing protein [Polaribacter undariae]UWD32092.1 T9SS type A sorting domain-containing protein [Polaribacter undariae]